MEKLKQNIGTITAQVQRRHEALVNSLEEKGRDGFTIINDEVVGYCTRIKGKYPENVYQNVRAYHALIGSSRGATTDDFPGEDSVLSFLTGLEEKYL